MRHGASKWALLIGVDQYHASIGKLKYSGADCRSLRDTLVSAAVGFPQDQVMVLDDAADRDSHPTYGNIHGVLASWLAAPQEDDLVLVYFAGHGRLVDGKTYLLPSDSSLQTIHTISIPLREVQAKLGQCKARRKVLVIDACHSGAGRDVGVMHADMAAALELASAGYCTITSCGAEEQSYEWDEKGHGVFSYFFNQALLGGCDPADDGQLSLDRIYEWVQKRVEQWAAVHRCSQRPMKFSGGVGTINLVDGRPGPVHVVGTGTVPAQSATPESTLNPAGRKDVPTKAQPGFQDPTQSKHSGARKTLAELRRQRVATGPVTSAATTGTAATRHRRYPALVLLGLALVGVVYWSYQANTGDSRSPPVASAAPSQETKQPKEVELAKAEPEKVAPATAEPETAKPESFEERLAGARRLARVERSLSDAITELRSLLTEEPTNNEVRRLLSQYIRKQAETLLAAQKLAEGYRLARDADGVDPDQETNALLRKAEECWTNAVLKSLTIRTPSKDAVVSESRVRVQGTVTDPSVSWVGAGGGDRVEVVGEWFDCWTKDLPEGHQNVEIECFLDDGPSAKTTVPLVIDRSDPIVTIRNPAEGEVTNGQLTVSVSVLDANVNHVSVNRVPATRDSSQGSSGEVYTCKLTLPAGNQKLTVEATDKTGRKAKQERMVLVDTTSPPLDVTAPADDLLTREKTVTVTGKTETGANAEVTCAGQTMPVALHADGSFSAEIQLTRNSRNELRVVVTDRVGHQTTWESQAVHDDQPPRIVIESPAQGAAGYVTGEVTVSGTVSDPHGPCIVTVDKEPATVTADGRWSASVSLEEGAHTLEVCARDAAGNATPPLRHRMSVQLMKTLDWAEVRAGTMCDQSTGFPQKVVDKQSGIVMVLVPAGKFIMGTDLQTLEALNDSEDGRIGLLAELRRELSRGKKDLADEHKRHEVQLSLPFYLAETEVTRAQWRRVMGKPPEASRREKDYLESAVADFPVGAVYWSEAVSFCSKVGLRLPTEAEWEYACRAGTETERYGHPRAVGWSADDGYKTYEVRRKEPNAWGLYDMLGNVQEWCADVYEKDYYRNSPLKDPAGPPVWGEAAGLTRVVRGGNSFHVGMWGLSAMRRSAQRDQAPRSETGFRPARTCP